MKCFYMPRQKCNVCKSKKSCEVCVEFWRREKRRNRCPSCNQLHWIRVLFEDCHSDICSGISNEYQELPKCPTIQLFFEDPAKITVGNFIDLYSVAQFSRFAAERSKWIHSTFIRDLPACECVYPIRHLNLLVKTVEESSVSSATPPTLQLHQLALESAETVF
jgi:hypothetical protein